MQKRGFTLIEVIIAVGLLAGSALAIIAFLGATGQATSEVMDRTVAARIADNVRAELDTANIDTLYTLADPNNATPLELFATKDGEHVRIGGPGGNVNNPPGDTPPGILERDRYFRIEIRRMENSLDLNSISSSESAMLPLSVQVVWPHHLPKAPNSPMPDYSVAEADKQSRYIFNTVILRKE